ERDADVGDISIDMLPLRGRPNGIRFQEDAIIRYILFISLPKDIITNFCRTVVKNLLPLQPD
ncbi:MAG: hypothetical protein LBF55_04035, partial [Prevotellaceae bacterium]|nr:hypothetical protein [Prevotellaceae bacterium]